MGVLNGEGEGGWGWGGGEGSSTNQSCKVEKTHFGGWSMHDLSHAMNRHDYEEKRHQSSTAYHTQYVWQVWYTVRVRRGYLVSASGCCTAVPGSNPARHPSLGSAQENPGAEKYRSRFFPAQQQEIPAQQQACQPVTKDEYCINTVDRKLQK
jgi:hypothetical protein